MLFQFKTKMQRSCETVILQGGLNCENSESNRSGFPQIRKSSGGYNFGPLLKEMKHTPVPEDVVYVPSAEELEALDVEKELKNRAFGGLPVQIGYCNGHNKS